MLLLIVSFAFLVGLISGEYDVFKLRKGSYNFYSEIYKSYKKITNNYNFQTITLNVSLESFKKIKQKRDSALIKRYMTNGKKDYVPVSIIWNKREIKGKLRLKGGMPDHYSDEKKWSFRIKIKEKNGIPMKNLALQHPKTRNYLNEWIFQKYIKFIGLINIEYDFVKVILNNENLGIYAMEESFTDHIFKKNNLTKGPIIKLDKGKFITDYKDECLIENRDWFDFSNDEYLNAKIDLYNDQEIDEDTSLRESFKRARELIYKYRNNEILANQIFDVKKMAKYIAAVNIFSAFHAINWNNMRFYFNPITCRLEPIAYDSNSSYYERVSPEKTEQLLMTRYLYNDTSFFISYVQELTRLSKGNELDSFFNSINEEMKEKRNILSSEFFNYNDDPSQFKKKATYIKKVINNTFISDVTVCLEKNYLTIINNNKFPIELVNIEENGKVVYEIKDSSYLFSKPFLSCPKKIKLSIPKEMYIIKNNNLKINYKIVGTNQFKKFKVKYYLCE